MRLLVVMSIVAITSAPAFASHSECKRLPLDEEFPGGVVGNYEFVGKGADGPAYSGTLTLGFGKSRYRVVHTVQGRSVYGTARFMQCGTEKLALFIVRLETRPVTEMKCELDADGDNYYRMTCLTNSGIEAWFQKQE